MNDNNVVKKNDIRTKTAAFILGAVLYFPVLAVMCFFERFALRMHKSMIVYFVGMIIAGILLAVFIYTATRKIHNDNIIKRILSVKIDDAEAVMVVAVVGIMVIPLLVLFWYGIFYAKSMLIAGYSSVFHWILSTVILAQTSFKSCYITLRAVFAGRGKSAENIIYLSAAMSAVNILMAVLMIFFGLKFYIL